MTATFGDFVFGVGTMSESAGSWALAEDMQRRMKKNKTIFRPSLVIENSTQPEIMAIHSIMISASLGRRTTSTAARAGG